MLESISDGLKEEKSNIDSLMKHISQGTEWTIYDEK